MSAMQHLKKKRTSATLISRTAEKDKDQIIKGNLLIVSML